MLLNVCNIPSFGVCFLQLCYAFTLEQVNSTMIRNDYDPHINLFKHCFDHKSCHPRLVTALDIFVALVFFIGGGFLVYGIVHVTGDNRTVVPLINSVGAFQSLQASLHMTEYGMYWHVNVKFFDLCVSQVFLIFLFC